MKKYINVASGDLEGTSMKLYESPGTTMSATGEVANGVFGALSFDELTGKDLVNDLEMEEKK